MKKKKKESPKKITVERNARFQIDISCDVCSGEDSRCDRCQAVASDMACAAVRALSMFPGEKFKKWEWKEGDTL